jgi:tripartite-type tricarboxylate transporter receptor subunit TctC
MTQRSRSRRRLLAAALIGALATSAFAQKFPTQPIKLVVPFAPGGGNDLLARAVAPRLAEALGQPVLVDNRAGAGGNVGTDIVAKAPADGHTLLIASNQITINPALGWKTPFDIKRDFAPVGLMASVPIVLVVNKEQPYNSFREFAAYARAHPGKVSYSSPGNGTPQHLAGEVFARMTNTPLVHVPYRGTSPALTDVVGGQVQATFGTLASLMPFLEAGRLKPLGVAGQRRSKLLPNVPTFGDEGLKGYDAELWYCLLAPAKTPQAVVDKLNAALKQALESPAVATQLAKQGFETASSTPEQLRSMIDRDLARWAKVIAENQIKVEQ